MSTGWRIATVNQQKDYKAMMTDKVYQQA
jgi:hypothetical protein